MGTKVFDNALDLITFSRASGGTSLRKISYGDELVTNTWIDESAGSSSISEVDGEITLNCVGADVAWAYEQVTLKAGSVYVVSYEVIQAIAGNVHIYIGETTAGGQSYSKLAAVGAHTESFVASANTSYISLREFSTGTAIVRNVSIKEVLFDQPNGTLQLFTHPDDIPRIDYNPDGTVKGLLVEEQRTNLDANSNTFTPYGNATVTQNQAVSPSGETDAVLLAENAGGSNAVYFGSVTTTAGAAYSASVYVKYKTGAGIAALFYRSSSNANQFVAWFDIKNGTKLTLGASLGTMTSIASTIEDAGNGWYRISATGTDSVETILNPFVSLTTADNTSEREANAECYIWGAQVEAGAFPTSYIPTSGQTKTRAADVASIPVSAFGYNQSAGTVVVESILPAEVNQNAVAVELKNAATTNRIVYNANNGTFTVIDNNVSQASIDGVDQDESRVYKVALRFADNDFALSTDGATPSTDTTGTIPSVDTLFVGRDKSAVYFNGHIKSIQYFPRRLTNAQLQELTT